MFRTVAILISTFISFSVSTTIEPSSVHAFEPQQYNEPITIEYIHQNTTVTTTDTQSIAINATPSTDSDNQDLYQINTISPMEETAKIIAETDIPSPIDITSNAESISPVLKVVESYESIIDGLIVGDNLITDFSYLGAIAINNNNSSYDSTKVIIKKDSKSYLYTIDNNESPSFLPLQLGSGEYTVSLLEGSSTNGYSYISKNVVIDAEIETNDNVFLLPMQYNSWVNNEKFIELIDQITANSETEEEIVSSIHNYMVDNFSYNYSLASAPPKNYTPDISLLLEEKTGICYDYSAIFSAALRYKGIPTKIMKGYTTTVPTYHSWNEVLIDGVWKTVDVTVDYYNKSNGMPYTIAKDSSNYQTQYYY